MQSCLARVAGRGVYELKDTAVTLVLRHRTRDVDIFDEIFVGVPAYRPPPRFRRCWPPSIRFACWISVATSGCSAHLRSRSTTSLHLPTFEPDPGNVPVLRRCLDSNPDRAWQVIEACAACRDGVVQFSGGKYADSHIAFNGADATFQAPAVDVFHTSLPPTS